ncbi:MAG: DUF2207 domain-containing protein [Candidatus Gastranaerophilales bacterium]|nr:DUF2207 domain-containing protein [Candidatus Gastranaerophilales bacterium]
MKKFILFIVILAINFLIANVSLAANYYIKNYDVEMDITEQKNINITETIDVFFTSPSHGIYRKIPFKNQVVRADDTTYTSYADIDNVSVNHQYTLQNQNNYLNIKIGSPEHYVNGDVKYVIKYTYTPINDDSSNIYDEFYFNIIGIEWDTTIEKSSFYINMPYSFETNKIGLSVGSYGTVGFNKGEAEVFSNGKTIEGNIKRPLKPYEAVTIRVELPQNYFSVEKKTDIGPIGIIILLTLIVFFIWLQYGKDDQVIPVVNFYPPERKNSAEISVEYKGSACNKAIVSLIIYLASKGYIRIDDSTPHSYSLHKIKEYDGTNTIERGLMDALFGGYNYVLKEDLERSTTFYEDCKKLKEKLDRIKFSIFEKNATSWEKITIITLCMIGIIITLLFVLGGYSFDFIERNPDIIILPFIFLAFGSYAYSKVENANIVFRIIYVIWSTGFILSPMINAIKILRSPQEHLALTITCFICIIISTICLINMPKRSRGGNKCLGEILGFKKFLEVAEKNRLRKLVQENPSYCYDVLPFAYVLGISEEWIKKFEGLMLEPPSWYNGHFSHRKFARLMGSIEAASVPSTENGGIDVSSSAMRGGGGFSGGGFGGGGGGAW